MPLGTRVKIKVFSNDKYIKTILRCLRPSADKYFVYFDNHVYLVHDGDSYGRYINLGK